MSFSALDSELTGPLFAAQEMRAVFSDRARLAAMLRVEAALARAEARFGLVPDALAAAIEAVRPEDLDIGQLGAESALAGVPTIPFLNALRAKLPKELEPSLHLGATTQDVLDTALVLQLREAFALMRRELQAIIGDLAKLAAEHRTTPCIGRTYGQHAAPITFGFKVAVWLTGIAGAAERLPRVQERVLCASLGGPVGTLANLGENGPGVVEAFARELGLTASTVSWHTLRGRMVETGSWLATLLGALAKMAIDVAHLASTEVAEVAEAHVPGRGGSSSMPHKRNPISATLIIAAHSAAKGHVVTLIEAMAAAHERPAGAWHAEWHALPQLFGLASGALREASRLAAGLEVHQERMRANLELTQGLIFADAAAAALAPRLGRGPAHELVEAAASEVRTTGMSLSRVLERRLGPLPPEDRERLDRAFDLRPAIEAAAQWTDRALAAAERSLACLNSEEA